MRIEIKMFIFENKYYVFDFMTFLELAEKGLKTI
jgi:hypothetical protein